MLLSQFFISRQSKLDCAIHTPVLLDTLQRKIIPIFNDEFSLYSQYPAVLFNANFANQQT